MKRKFDWFLPGLLCAVALAWLFPNPGASGGWMHPEILTKVGIALIFFLHGVALSFENLKAGMLRWPLHLIVQPCTFPFFPLLGLVFLQVFGALLFARFESGVFLPVRAALDGFLVGSDDRSGARQRAGRSFQRHFIQHPGHFSHAAAGEFRAAKQRRKVCRCCK